MITLITKYFQPDTLKVIDQVVEPATGHKSSRLHKKRSRSLLIKLTIISMVAIISLSLTNGALFLRELTISFSIILLLLFSNKKG